MTLWYKLLFFYLWIAPHLLLMVVAVLLLKKRLYTNFPVFTLYTCYEIAEFVLLLAMAVTGLNRGALLIPVYLVTLGISTALRFGVLQEVFNNIFREHVQLHALARISLRWTTGFLLATAVLGSIFAFAQTSDSAIADVAWLGRGIALIQGGFGLFLPMFSPLVGLSRVNGVCGFALGFGIRSMFETAH